MAKKQFSKSEIKELNSRILESFGIENFFGKKDDIILLKDERYIVSVTAIARPGNPKYLENIHISNKLIAIKTILFFNKK